MNAVIQPKIPLPAYSKSAVKRAGETLLIPNIASIDPERHLEALKALSYWRACHLPALDTAVREVEEVVAGMRKGPIVAKRLKRAPSIISKLQRYPKMDLQNMQDIGGCRVIVRSAKHVHQVRRALQRQRAYRVKDYIKSPKEDGYRGIHLVGKFAGKEPGSKYHIEIQVRTAIQHAWATAVEIIDLFTRQHLKANLGKPEWQEFFCLAGEALAALDKADTETERHTEVCTEVLRLANRLNVVNRFAMFSSSLRILEEKGVKGVEGYYLLEINTKRKTVGGKFFPIASHETAVESYLQSERASLKSPELVVALVSTDSVSGLQEAYPNYFADSAVFVDHLHTIMARARVTNPNWITRFFLDLGWKKRV